MSEMEQIKSKIAITEAALTDAKSANDRNLIIMHGNQLTEQLREKNLLLTPQRKFSLQFALLTFKFTPFCVSFITDHCD